jgi:hypothetical protein
MFRLLWQQQKPPARLALAEQRFGQLRQLHRGQFDGWLFGVGCLLTAGDGRDEQRALCWKAGRLGVEEGGEGLEVGGKVVVCFRQWRGKLALYTCKKIWYNIGAGDEIRLQAV